MNNGGQEVNDYLTLGFDEILLSEFEPFPLKSHFLFVSLKLLG